MHSYYKGLKIGHTRLSPPLKKRKAGGIMRAIYNYFLSIGFKRLAKKIDKAGKKYNKLKGG